MPEEKRRSAKQFTGIERSLQRAETVYDAVGEHIRGELSAEELKGLEDNHFPFSGACDTATSGNTAGIYTEALGLALPGSSTLPAGSTYQLRAAKYTGMRVMDLLAEDLRPSNILTRDAVENAMRVGMAVGGSTNMVLHFTAMAKEAGVDVSFETWDALSRTTPTLRYSHYRTRWQDGWGNWHWGRCDPKWWGRGAFQQT